MIPDFNRNTIETLAKRAAYKCSNPDCRVSTVGPNTDPDKSTIIGEAAHIYGARIGSKRYNPNMTDAVRAEITNSIWVCRNCHKLIDTDEIKYSTNTLFVWREKHEEYIASNLGNITDKITHEEQISILKDFANYPLIVKRIIIDKPFGWEYRLTAELMRFLNEPLYRRLNDLQSGLYLKQIENLNKDGAFNWIHDRISELTRIAQPAVGLLNLLTKSWGKPGEPGNVQEIHHVTKLIKDYLEQVIYFEERIHFVNVPEEYRRSVDLLKNLIGSQVKKLSSIPSDLDDIITLSKELREQNIPPKVITKEWVFELPDYWENEFSQELNKLKNNQFSTKSSSSGCLPIIVVFVIVGALILLI